MGARGTLFLALALAGAVIYAWFDAARDSPTNTWQAIFDTRPTPPSELVRRLFDFDPTSVVAVRVRKGDVEVTAVRENGGWAETNRSGAVDDLLEAIADLAEIAMIDVEPEKLAEYGLRPPRSVITLERRELAAIVLLVGDRNPTTTALYAQIGRNGQVVLTGALLLWELDKAMTGMRSADNS